MADPVSMEMALSAIRNLVEEMSSLAESRIALRKPASTAERFTNPEHQVQILSQRFTKCLDLAGGISSSVNEYMELQKVFSTLSDLYRGYTRLYTKRDLHRLLKEYRRQCEILESMFLQNERLEVSGKLSAPATDDPRDRIPRRLQPTTGVENAAPPQAQPYNLSPVSGSKDSSIVIVFVHGFGGDARKTWTGIAEHGSFWPEELLSHDQELPPCQILNFEYNTSHYFKEKPIFDSLVYDFRNSLRPIIESQKSKGGVTVLVAHSLGGLLVKAAIVTEHDNLFSQTKLALFLFGTPHNFSSVAVKTRVFKTIISASVNQDKTSVAIKNVQGEELMTNEKIERIAEAASRDTSVDYDRAFMNALRTTLKNTQIVSFFETDSTLTDSGNLKLVEDFNTTLGHRYEKHCFLPGNHITMTKFESRDDNGYTQFAHELKNALRFFEAMPELAAVGLWGRGRSVAESPGKGKDSVKKFLTVDDLTLAGRSKSQGNKPRSMSTQSSGDGGAISNLALDFTTRRSQFQVDMATWRSFKKHKNMEQGTWFLSSKEYHDWFTDRLKKGLILRGPSGCGKTFVAESVFMKLSRAKVRHHSPKKSCVLHLFFRFEETAGHDFSSILKALIAQVLDLEPALIRHVPQVGDGDHHAPPMSEYMLCNTLRILLQDTCWTDVYVVIDALDECSEASSMYFNSWSAKPTPTLGDGEPTGPLQALFALMMDLPALRFIATTTQDIYGLPESLLWPLEARGAITEVSLCKLEGFKDDFRTFLKSQVSKRVETRVADSDGGLYVKHLSQLSLELECNMQPSFRLAYVCLEYFDFLWTKRAEAGLSEIFWSTKFANIQHRHTLYSELLAQSAIGKDPGFPQALTYLPRLQKPLDLASLEMIIRLNDASHTKLEDAINALDRDSRTLNWKEISWAVREDGGALRLCSDDIRRFCASWPWKSNSEASSNPEPLMLSDSEQANMTYRVHARIARACLKLEKLHDDSMPSASTEEIPALKYAKTFWSRHVRLAGPCAIELNPLIAARSQRRSKMAKDPSHPLLSDLATNNLAFNLSTMFLGSNELLNLSPDSVSGVFDEVVKTSSVATLRTLRKLEQKASSDRSSGSNTMSERQIIYFVRTFRISDFGDHGVDLLNQTLAKLNFQQKVALVKYSLKFQNHSVAMHTLSRLPDDPALNTHDSALKSSMPKIQGITEIWNIAISVQDQEAIAAMAIRSTLFDKNSGLLIAAGVANARICELLLRSKADPDYSRENGKTALHIASETGQKHLVELLLSWRARPNARDSEKRTALHLASERGHTDVVGYLLSSSTLKDEVDSREQTPLFAACAKGYRSTAAQLWSHGSSLAHKDKYDRTVLHAATAKGATELVQFLIDAGVPISAKNKIGRTALHEAAEHGYGPVVDVLLGSGADVFAEDRFGCTPLHRACLGRTTPEVVVMKLARHDAPINAVSNKLAKQGYLQSTTPLHLAAKFGTARLVEILLSIPGASQSLRMSDGSRNTPYMCAESSAREQRAKMKLLSRRETRSSVG